ncbi:hypothetical protein [Formosa sp. S-31]|uniref:hypothetical protein n=1 Tax=Formosa sp. S-31 TaxID=2790949 RepID=UPI003EC12F7D
MNLFNQRKNKSFNYKPKFQEDNKKASEDMSSKWQDIKQSRKHKGKRANAIWRWLLLLALIIILWYVLSNYEM